ncbi:CesD/SycD/LcrH family type III secretion system chaperone [bacterium]|nr:CesD/SycD/LcrH family type III secretion system chaperone [bacterium]
MSDATNTFDVENAVRDLMQAFPADLLEKSENALQAISEGASIGDVYNIEPRKLEMVYSVARTFYANRKYDDALAMFRFLTLMDHTNQKFWIGYASTLQMMKDYEKAVEAYGFATILDIDNPKPQLQAGYCLIQLGKLEEAICALEGALMTEDVDDKTRLQAEALLAKINRAESSAE